MTQPATLTPKQETTPRFTTPQPRMKKQEKKDRKEIIKNWTLKTNIVQRIKDRPTNKVQTMIIDDCTPDMAMDILTLLDIGKQRYIDESRVTDYTEEMKSGTFPVNGDTFKISKTYKLIDGQHRLWAIWESGKSMPIIIVTGLEDKVIANIDIGKNRTAHDMVVIRGYSKHGTAMAAAIKSIIYYEKTFTLRSSLGSRDVPNAMVDKWLNKKAQANDLNEFIEFGIEANQKVPKWLSISQWAFIYYTLYNLPFNDPEKSQKRVFRFLSQFTEGNDMGRNDPIMVLRRYFMTDFKEIIKSGKRNRLPGGLVTMKIKLVFEAWNKFFKGEKNVNELEIDNNTPIIPMPLFR